MFNLCCVEEKNDLSFFLSNCLISLHLSSSEMEQRLHFHWIKAIPGHILPDMIAGCLLAGKLGYAAAVAADGHLAQGSLHLAGCHRLRLRNNLLIICLLSLHFYRTIL
jgi:hypothetical protein